MLEVRNLSVAYGQHRALQDVSLRIERGEIVVILGANGAGKSTLLKTIGGLRAGTHSGSVTMDGVEILDRPTHRIVESGIALVPEGRGVFGDLTVRENLLLGAYCKRARAQQQANLDRVLRLFPKLAERQSQAVRTMSGGEQQMIGIGRAMMSNPAILMLDEPSLGLAPLICRELFRSLTEVREAGPGILLVEQNAKQSLAIADRGYVLENAHIMIQDTAANLAGDPAVQKAYLGGAAPKAAAAVPQPVPAPAVAAAAGRLNLASLGGAAARVRTDAVVPDGIDQLVRRAAQVQSDHVAAARAAARAATGADYPKPADFEARPTRRDGRLAEVLVEIEQAAEDARLGQPAAALQPKPKIYRRAPGDSGKLDKVEEEGDA